MKRREFLQGSVFAGTAGILMDACTPTGSEQVIPILIPEEEFVPGVEEWLPTTCFECAGGCGLLVRKIDGRLVKIEGNPDHPISRGNSCARAQALPQALYHPDRLRGPRLREGERGAGGFREISWEAAGDRLAAEVSRALDEGAAARIAFLTGELRGHRREIVRRFLAALGSPHHLVHEPFSEEAVRRAHELTVGEAAFLAPDLENTSYLVSFGAGLIESSRSPVRFSRGIAHMRRGRPGRRAKWVAVEPRLSLSAANADEWLPARPGTEAAVALALAHVLLRDGLAGENAIGRAAEGLEDLKRGLEDRFTPAAVAAAAGVEERALVRIAHEMHDNRPAIVLAGGAAVSGRSGLAAALAVSHLNALLGSYGATGGLLRDAEPPFAPWPAVSGSVSSRPLAASIDVLRSCRLLLVSGTNPVHSAPSSGIERLLDEAPFVVSFASFLDETAARADLILPEPTPFERWDDDVPSPGVGTALASLSAPRLARPLYDLRSMPDVLIELAQAVGGPLASAFAWSSYEEALRDAWSGLPARGGGSAWSEALETGGWWAERGEAARRFGPYRFAAEPIAALELEPFSGNEEFPLVLEVYPSLALGDGRSAHLPFLQELADPMTGARWGSVVEIHPRTAAEHGAGEGDLVEVVSEHGRLEAPVRLTPGLRPGLLALAAGQGHTSYGRYASHRGANAFALLAPEAEAPSRARVRIRKV